MAHSAAFCLYVSASVVEGLGLLLTAWRIYFRLKIGLFWWEDGWAAILLATGLFWIIAFWICLLAIDGLTSIVTFWIYCIGFNCIVTLARMSILFSIIRIIYSNSHILRFSYACVAFFVACWVIVIVEKVWQWTSDPSWYQTTVPSGSSKPFFCLVAKHVFIFKFTTDCIAVSILVVLPLHILWRVKLPRHQRRMILFIFASSIVLVFGALFHTIGQILNNNVVITVGLHVEVALSIIVCNLLVVVTYTYHLLLHDKGHKAETVKIAMAASDDDNSTTQTRPPATLTTSRLTTVDLDASFSTSQESSATLEGN